MTFNLMQLFQQQYRTFGSFGAQHSRRGLAKTAGGMLPVIDTEAELPDFERGLARIEGTPGVRSSIDTLYF
jgi:alcohol dehydrogenase